MFCKKELNADDKQNHNCMNEKESFDKLQEVMEEAVKVIYFNDNSDYLSALQRIVNIISPEIYEQLNYKEREAFVRVVKKGEDL